MRETEFRDWLNKRRFRGAPLSRNANNSRMAWARAAERSLPLLGFEERDLDEVLAAGRWNDLLATLSALSKDWHINEDAARKIAPEANDPGKQLTSTLVVVRQYGRFATGIDPNFDTGDADIEGDASDEHDGVADATSAVRPMVSPTNLILYGPPGTGKTWRTAYEAVALCDEAASEDRDVLMARYRELVEAQRIAFVTFHQSFSYEEFVEGLRPPTGNDSEETGLRLNVHHGIFRNIAALARAGGGSAKKATFSLAGRRIFKMSLGRARYEDEIYDSAIDGNYISLGWGGKEDWSAPKYDGDEGYQAIFDRWNEIEPGTSGNSGNIGQVWRFRGSMRPGDIVLVPHGNSAIRAIGEVIGAYRFVPDDPFGYYHHRDVKWLRVFDEPVPVSAVSDRDFTQASCYLVKSQYLRDDALLNLIGTEAGGAAKGEALPYVLIIDEINRANISRVFGELITLIEPDKRLDMPNALKVKLPYSQDEFGVPANLHIIGTMNTADRSIALLDTALRRRFIFREIAPDPALLEDVDGIPLRRVLEAINDRIEYLIDRDHRIGHAFFINCTARKGEGGIDAVMREKVIPLLQEYFFEDWSRIAAVLHDLSGRSFLERRELPSPLPDSDGAKTSWSVRSEFAEDAYDHLLGKSVELPLEQAAE